ncbi:unnamed protein product [Hydatigera taeniaeformis]|uniref:Uncharacterized protein n=1 Tax=Hydatigena taeniaeformis TaxID=6205 RepID=A0A0R3WQT8_HYDTA|nr:unnamed protein product [Hydatigera taeniaeformis]
MSMKLMYWTNLKWCACHSEGENSTLTTSVSLHFQQKDALTVRRMESPFSPSSWQDKDFLAPWRSTHLNKMAGDTHSVNFADHSGGFRQSSPAPSICSSRSVAGSSTVGRHGIGPTPTGSLIVFRVHSAITDDAQSLVEFLTILLSEGIFEEGERSSVNFPEPGTSSVTKARVSRDGTVECSPRGDAPTFWKLGSRNEVDQERLT